MRWLLLALFTYCIIALVVTGWVFYAQLKAVANARNQLSTANIELAEKSGTAEQLKLRWLELDSIQREHRAEYDGPEAVESSYQTQQALEQFRVAELRQAQSQALVDNWNSKKQIAEKNLIPLSIGALIHLVALALLWPSADKRRSGLNTRS